MRRHGQALTSWHAGVIATMTALAAAGCGSSTDDGSTGDSSSLQTVRRDNRRPEEVIRLFCEGLRSGDHAAVDAMLTPAARKHRLLTPAKTEAEFRVGKVEFNSETESAVETSWTTVDQEGRKYVNSAVWTLRLEPEGWRVYGMKAEDPDLVENRHVSLDFERPEEFARVRQRVHEERIARGLDAPDEPEEKVADRPDGEEATQRRK